MRGSTEAIQFLFYLLPVIINLPVISLIIVLLSMHIRIFTKILCLRLRNWQLNFCMRLKLEGYDRENTFKLVAMD